MTDMRHPGTTPHDTGTASDPDSAPNRADPIADWAASLVKLLGTALRDIDIDRERARASIATAATLLRVQIERAKSPVIGPASASARPSVEEQDGPTLRRGWLIHANRVATLGEMSASIVHEVNQPLAAIAANAAASLSWLTRANPEVGEAILAIRDVLADVERASGMIQRIRALSRNNEPEMSKLDINRVIDDVITLINQEAHNRRVSLQLDREPRLPSVHGDAIQLQQVIINLMVNGIQAMASLTDRSRKLVIRAREYDSHSVLVAVEDVGVGTEAEDLDQLFGAFYSTKSSGMGMGLAISRSIIEAHRGRIWASRNSGQGMTFQFTLPIHGAEA